MKTPNAASDRAAPTLPKHRNAQIRFYYQLLATCNLERPMPAAIQQALVTLCTARDRIRCYRSSSLNDLNVTAAIRLAHTFLGFSEESQPLVNGCRK